MCEPIMVACDLHDKTMLLMLAQGRAEPEKLSVANSVAGRARLIADLQERSRQAGGAALIFAYEASGLGFGLHDELTEAGIACHVLAPTKIARSAQHGRRKTDEQDARQILHLLRGHVLAGNPLPSVWIPRPQTRDDRELVRLRIDLAQKRNAVKVQIKTLLKRAKLVRPAGCGRGWTKAFLGWLKEQAQQPSWGVGLRSVLASLLSQMQFLEGEIQRVEQQDHKGHITRQGPARVRHILCQAAWATLLRKGNDYPAYARIVERNPKHKKIAVVAVMRRLAVRMWHEARDAQTTDRTAESTPAESSRRTESRRQQPGLRGFSRSVHAKLNPT